MSFSIGREETSFPGHVLELVVMMGSEVEVEVDIHSMPRQRTTAEALLGGGAGRNEFTDT